MSAVKPLGTLAMETMPGVRFAFGGFLGQRLQANLEEWLLLAPCSNPAMLEMFRDRDRTPRRDLVPWAGEFAGKYLTSATLAWRTSPDSRLQVLISRLVADLIATQDEGGYLGPFPRAERYVGKTLDGTHDLWDLWGHYHGMLGLLLWHRESGDGAALAACCRAANGICDRFLGRGQMLDAGAEEMNMAVAHILGELYLETGEGCYLEMLRQIEREWEISPAGDYVRQALAGVPFWQTPKPRWESLHDIQAILSLYRITGEERYRRAFAGIWGSIRDGDRHNSGGFSSGEKATGNPFDRGAIETCCTVAWMALSVDMLRLTGGSTVADELELATFNAALGAQSPSGRWWTYNTPMDGVRKASAHEIVFQAREGSSELNCCSVNGPRTLGMLSEWALLQTGEGIALNYYGPCELSAPLDDGRQISLAQQTDYPRDGQVQIRIGLEAPSRLTLMVRIPAWSSETLVSVCGVAQQGVVAGRYLALNRVWQNGDEIALTLDMRVRPWHGERECAGKVCLYRGPLLLAYDRRYNGFDPGALAISSVPESVQARRYDGPDPAPWLLVQAGSTVGGEPLTLCDFATAGAAGTPYVTWLPLHSGA